MKIGGVMKVSLVVVIAALGLLAAGCGGSSDGSEVTLGQGQGGSTGDTIAVSEKGDIGVASSISYPTTTGSIGTLPGITVTGSGTAHAVPDVADWSFGVQSDAGSAKDALAQAAAATRKIVDALRNAGVAKEDLRTEQVSLYPRTSNDGLSVIGYSASSSVHATVRDLGKAGSVVDTAVKAGANQVYGPSLRVSDNQAQYRAAVDAAMDDARARAQALAARAGVTLGGPIAIVESGVSYPGPVYDRAMAAGAESAVPIEPGIDQISAALTVTFAIS
jgi:uncharacterized protein YggE